MTYHENCKNTLLLNKLEETTAQSVRMLRRIATRSHGLKENDMVQLVQAFVVFRIVYVDPYAVLGALEREILVALLRKAYKQALALPTSTSTVRLTALGRHNTIEELIEAHLTAQK